MEGKYFANKGVARNKRPLKNIVYQIELSDLSRMGADADKSEYEKYKFKELGYLVLIWWHQEKNPDKCWHGFITPAFLK